MNVANTVSVCFVQVHWSYSDGGKFTDYPGEINSMLENAYQANKRNHEWKDDNDVTYRVDFNKMIETTRANHNGVPVKRTIVGGTLDLLCWLKTTVK